MSFIPLSAVGNSGIKAGPPWCSRLFVLSKGPAFLGKGSAPASVVARLSAHRAEGQKAAASIMLRRGAVSGGNTKTRRRYEKTGKKPARTLAQIVGK